MEEMVKILGATVFVGVGATAVLDIWMLALKGLGVPSLNFALLGRWIGHMVNGQWKHERIAGAAEIHGEEVLGWVTHYAIGIAFAAVLVIVNGSAWLVAPTLMPALLTGIATVTAPLCIMQPAMGNGLAFARTPRPLFNCFKSLVNHGVFGCGLYVAAVLGRVHG